MHVIERIRVEIVAVDDADGDDRRQAAAQEEHVANCDLSRKASDQTAVELLVAAVRTPRTGVSRSDQSHAVLEEHLRK